MILGLDMSSKKSGYCLFEGQQLKEYGLWEMQYETESDWRERIKWMSKQLSLYCDKYDITKIYCEDVPPVLENTQTIKILSALQGCIISLCQLNNIEVKFVSVPTWKNIVGIDMKHSKEFKKFIKDYPDSNCSKFKDLVKAYEKKLSVDYANSLFNIDLVWSAPSSKFNMDDVADSINIVVSQEFENIKKCDVNTFNDIFNIVYNKICSDKLKTL